MSNGRQLLEETAANAIAAAVYDYVQLVKNRTTHLVLKKVLQSRRQYISHKPNAHYSDNARLKYAVLARAMLAS